MQFSATTCPHRPSIQETRSLLIFLHGYGADGNDLIDIADEWAQLLPNTTFLSPHAPQPCMGNPFGGRQWFPLTTLSDETLNSGTHQATPDLLEFIESAKSHFKIDKIALVGFSQGAMMALHVGFRVNVAPVAVIGYSGRLTNASTLLKEAKNTPPIFLAHGTHDEVVPFSSMQLAETVFKNAGVHVETYAAHGVGHGIDGMMLHNAGVFLQKYI